MSWNIEDRTELYIPAMRRREKNKIRMGRYIRYIFHIHVNCVLTYILYIYSSVDSLLSKCNLNSGYKHTSNREHIHSFCLSTLLHFILMLQFGQLLITVTAPQLATSWLQ